MGCERTLVILKPDALKKRLVGRIISRLEDAGLKILAMRLVEGADPELISAHYQSTEKWLEGVGKKTIESNRKSGDDVVNGFGTDIPIEIGKIVKKRLIKYMTSGPIIPMIIEGNHGIRKVRQIAGYTIPAEAAPGTIRGDFSSDSPDLATCDDRSVENLVHASGNENEAEYEINLWFPEFPG